MLQPERLLFRDEDQEIVHAVAFDEIILCEQRVAGFQGFADDDVFGKAVVFAVPVAINNSEFGRWAKRGAQIAEGQTVPLEPVLDRLRVSIARMEADEKPKGPSPKA